MSRRLPIYLLLDTSGSMAGEAIQAVQQGVLMLSEAVKSDPMALETAWLSVITFDSSAQVLVPLVDADQFNPPIFQANGMTSFGLGLEKLMSQIETEVKKSSATQKGDYRPMVFVMTDGQPSDSYENAANKLRAKNYHVIGCAAGGSADVGPLKKISETVIKLKDCNSKSLQAFFKWVSTSATVASTTVNNNPNQPVNLPPLPDDDSIEIIP